MSHGLSTTNPTDLIRVSNSELSVYADPDVTIDEITICLNRLKKAFPAMDSNDFYNLLAERVKENGFSGRKLKDAVNHVIDNFQYKELNISDVVRFDRKAKLYTYDEVCIMVTKGLYRFEDFQIVEINGSVFRVMKKDLVR